MIKEFADRFMSKKEQVRDIFSIKHPDDYKEIVKIVVEALHDADDISPIDPERITQIDDGNHDGILVFVIAESGYQPFDYWYVKVGYGSCSGCDTLERIRQYSDKKPSEEQAHDYLILALHIVQRLKKMDEEVV